MKKYFAILLFPLIFITMYLYRVLWGDLIRPNIKCFLYWLFDISIGFCICLQGAIGFVKTVFKEDVPFFPLLTKRIRAQKRYFDP